MKNRKVKNVYYVHGFKLRRTGSKRPGLPSFALFLMLSGFMVYGIRADLMPSPTALLHTGTQKIAASVLKESPTDGDKSVLSSNAGGKKPQKIKTKNKELNQQLAIKARQYDKVKWSIYVEDVNSGLTASYNEDAGYKFGSVSRLAVLPALETKINPDRWNNYYFGSSVKDCVNKGLGQANDACYDKLTKYLGAEYINKTVKSYGYDIEFDGSFNADTSTEKMGTYIVDLKQGQSLFAKTRRALFDALYTPKQTAGLSLGCGDCRVANKQSYDKNTAIDAGVVTHGSRSYVVVVVAEGGTFDQITDMAQTIDRYMQP